MVSRLTKKDEALPNIPEAEWSSAASRYIEPRVTFLPRAIEI